ncbi:hypothetical protein ACFLQY_02845 [Verrucomicrobiota bacterium]
MKEVVDGVEARFDLAVLPVPEFKDDQERQEKYQRSMQIGMAYMEQGAKQDALRKYVYAFRINPDLQDALFMVGILLIEMKDYESAVTVFNYLEELHPSDFRLQNNLGWIYATAEDPRFRDGRKAEEYASKALLYAPQDHHVWSTLAEARYVYGNYEAAARAAQQALTLAQAADKDEAELRSYQELLDKCDRALDYQKQLAESMGEQK